LIDNNYKYLFKIKEIRDGEGRWRSTCVDVERTPFDVPWGFGGEWEVDASICV
jgi:hypothetical protein